MRLASETYFIVISEKYEMCIYSTREEKFKIFTLIITWFLMSQWESSFAS